MNAPRIGFLGAGLIATYHSKSLRRSGVDYQPAGVYDPDSTRSAAFAAASGHRPCRSASEVLDDCDAVYVATWTAEHRALVEQAVDRGVHVFCEKPLATTLADAEAMTERVTAAGVVNMVGLVLRRSPAFVVARSLIAVDGVGPVVSVVFRDDQFIPIQGHYASSWRSDHTKAGAGTLLEHSIHDVDLLRFLVGEVAEVSMFSANHHGYPGIEDVASATLRFTDGALGTLLSVWHDNLARPSLRRIEVFCAERHVVIDGDDWVGPVSWTDSDGCSAQLGGDDLVAAAAAHLDTDNADEVFVEAVVAHQAGRQPRHAALPDFATALAAHRVVDAMYRSADERRAITL